MEGGLPVIEHVIDHTIEPLFGWVPRFHEVMVDMGVVDRADSSVGIGVSRQQCTFGIGIKFNRLFEELDTGHAGHALIDEEKRDRLVAEL